MAGSPAGPGLPADRACRAGLRLPVLLVTAAALIALAGCAGSRAALVRPSTAPAEPAPSVAEPQASAPAVVPSEPSPQAEEPSTVGAPPGDPAEPPLESPPTRSQVEEILRRGVEMLGSRHVRAGGGEWSSDCSGFVSCCYGVVDLDLADERFAGGALSATMWRTMQERGLVVDLPERGDLVFFDETYDRNRNGHRDDGVTHVGIVEEVPGDGSVVFLHFGSGRVKRDRLSMTHPDLRFDGEGEVLNSYLRHGSGDARLAGQLLRGFARPLAAPPGDQATAG